MEANKRKNQPTMLQLRYLTELEKMPTDRGFISLIAERCGVSHVAVSKYMRSCVESGILTEEYTFTEMGKTWLHTYQQLAEDLAAYLRDIGVPESETEENVRTLMESADPYTLQAMVQDHTTAQRRLTTRRRTQLPKDFRAGLQGGKCRVQFKLYRMNSRQNVFSMANQGFDKVAYLANRDEKVYLELTIRQMDAASRLDGRMMAGHLQTLKYELDGELRIAPVEDRKVEIPMEACRFHRGQGGEMMGMIPVTLTCSVGCVHMPESTAMLLFWM